MSLRIAIVAGEYSGDILGASLIKALKEKQPDIITYGVAGPQMVEAGCNALFSVESLAVMGIIEPIKHLPKILNIRHKLYQYIIKDRPNVFIGIDAPDFNLGLEIALRKKGIKIIHYVSPTVWAWRQKRIHKIKKAVDLVLTLFPFETEIYNKYRVPVKFVGHPLADEIPIKPDKKSARKYFELSDKDKVIALLPGSRRMEIKRLAQIFIKASQICLENEPNLKIISSMVNKRRHKQFDKILKKIAPNLNIKTFEKESHKVLEAADVVLLASGTVSLEAMLCKCPMVVAYKVSNLTYFIAKQMVKLKYISLPNLLADKKLVPEFLQIEVSPKVLAEALIDLLKKDQKKLIQEFTKIHKILKKDASNKAAKAVFDIIKT